MHAIIYGTGKWAQLISIKLKAFGFNSILIGNNNLVASYARSDVPHIAQKYQKVPVFIASATKDHFSDLTQAAIFNPTGIYVEKGFRNIEEKLQAKAWANTGKNKKTPVYILSQYRYTKILDVLEPFKSDIISVRHNWVLDKAEVSEWIPHIISIDNYVRGTSNEYYNSDIGTHRIDDKSSFTITKGMRNLNTTIETFNEIINLYFGITNQVLIVSKQENMSAQAGYQNEDCLTNQLKDIFTNNEKLRLERL